jgi:hypothetical protein
MGQIYIFVQKKPTLVFVFHLFGKSLGFSNEYKKENQISSNATEIHK